MPKEIMTLEQIEALPKDMLIPSDIAGYLGCSPYTINVATRDGENPFPFPVIRLGTRVRIPKIPFLKAMRGETVEEINSDLQGISTKELVDELRQRYGVKATTVDPEMDIGITVSGPAIVLVVTD